VAKQFPRIGLGHKAFIEAQKIFFVATAAPDGRVNLSPKGMDSLRVMDTNRIVWLNVTGSGNETAGHLRASPRMTVMWCSLDATPLILRAYGTARTVQRDGADWDALAGLFPGGPEKRQVFDMTVEMVQTSCGYAVPSAAELTERPTLRDWAARKGPDGIRAYWQDNNARTLDGAPTGIEDNL
jgi:hypothetical protein